MTQEPKWTADLVASYLTQLPSIASKLLVVPTCFWYGHEADLLVIENKLRIVDIEIKISRADLKADLKKDKWYRRRPWSRRHEPPQRLEWPDKVWKHYYAMPASIWTPELLEFIPAASGVIIVGPDLGYNGRPTAVDIRRRAVPNKAAKPISQADVFDIARLSSLRYWSLVRSQPRIARRHQLIPE